MSVIWVTILDLDFRFRFRFISFSEIQNRTTYYRVSFTRLGHPVDTDMLFVAGFSGFSAADVLTSLLFGSDKKKYRYLLNIKSSH